MQIAISFKRVRFALLPVLGIIGSVAACGPISIVSLGSSDGGGGSQDAAPRAFIGFEVTSSDVAEATFNHAVQLRLTLDGIDNLAEEVRVDFDVIPGPAAASVGLDFQIPASLTLAAGAVSGSVHPIVLPILDDALVEGGTPELIDLRIANIEWVDPPPLPRTVLRFGTPLTHRVSITDDEPLVHRVSVTSQGAQVEGVSLYSRLSADAGIVVFTSLSAELVPGDSNGVQDIFAHDRQAPATSRVSVSSTGVESDGISFEPALSGDGRWVAFGSAGSNLVAGDTNGVNDVFLHDRTSGATVRVSLGQGAAQANLDSRQPALSHDGLFVAFVSAATNLTPGDTNSSDDVFMHEVLSGTTSLVSRSSAGVQSSDTSEQPSCSTDGRFVAFRSAASNLIAGDTNGLADVFVHDRVSGTTLRVSVSSNGGQADGASDGPSMSGDGRRVAFVSGATNLVTSDANGEPDVFLRDLDAETTARMTSNLSGGAPLGPSSSPALSQDGSRLAFASGAADLVVGDTNARVDVFVRELASGLISRVSVAADGSQSLFQSNNPAISSDGRLVSFFSDSPNLVPGDTNADTDVFVASGPVSSSLTGPGSSNVFDWLATRRMHVGLGNGTIDRTLSLNVNGAPAGALIHFTVSMGCQHSTRENPACATCRGRTWGTEQRLGASLADDHGRAGIAVQVPDRHGQSVRLRATAVARGRIVAMSQVACAWREELRTTVSIAPPD